MIPVDDELLTKLRAEVADQLREAKIRAFEYVPERIDSNLAVVTPDNPYVEEGTDKPFGHLRVNMKVTLLVRAAGNQNATKELDSLIVRTVWGLPNWDVSVSEPFVDNLGNTDYLAATVSASSFIKLNRKEIN